MPPFDRTVCGCERCVGCCKSQPGCLAPHDIAAIRTEIGAKRFAETMVASPGALVGDTVTGKTFRIPTITPRKVGDRCVFLTAEGRCEIHAVAPFGCAYFDMHMEEDVYAPRSRWYLIEIMASPAYRRERAALPIKEEP